MNIKHMIASALVRRIVYVLVALALGALANLAKAQNTTSADQGEAFVKCNQAHAAAIANWNTSQYDNQEQPGCTPAPLSYQKFFSCGYQRRAKTCPTCGWITISCGAHSWTGGTCANRPPSDSGWYRVGSGTGCDAGCAYSGGTASETTTVAGFTYLKTSGRTPTGAVCDYTSNPDEEVTGEQCHTQGGLTQCVRPDGKHCAVASSGKKFCWQPSEAGVKAEGNEGATKSPDGTVVKPPSAPPPNGGEWTSGPMGQVSTSTNGGTTNNYTITNWNSSYGNQGSGTGSTNPDGSENPGNGDGNGDGDDDDDGPGPPTNETIGELYTPTDDTAQSLMQAFFDAAGDTQLLQSVNTFFGNCGYGGSCPSMQYENEYLGRLNFSQLCDGTMGDIFTFAGFCVLAVAAFGAWRIAIY